MLKLARKNIVVTTKPDESLMRYKYHFLTKITAKRQVIYQI